MDLNEAAVFVKVVDAGGFSAAARLLGVPTSTVSTRIARLEKRLGVTLLQRTTRRVHLTDTGQLYYRHASAGLGYILEAETAVTALVAEPKGLLRVTAPADIGDHILANILSRSRHSFPQVNVDMVLRNRYIDLVAEGVDVAIRTGSLKDSTLVAKKVGIACWVPFASPSYLNSAPALNFPQELRHHSCLQFTSLGKDAWTFSNGSEAVTVPMSGNVMANDVGVIRAMSLAGEGVALLPSYLCRSECEDGRLLRVLPEWHANIHEVNIVYPRQRFLPLKLRLFIDLASQELKESLGE